MKFHWNKTKDAMIRERPGGGGIWFSEAIAAIQIEKFHTLIVNKHPYEHQRIYVIDINWYTYHMPVVRKDNDVYCITLYPCRKSHKLYTA